MRRLVTSLFVALAVLFGSAAMTAFWFQQTAFSPERSELAARHALQSPVITNLAVDQVTKLTLSALPQPVVAQLGQDRIRASVREAVRDPKVVASLEQALAQAHRGIANGTERPVIVDGAPIARALGAQIAKVSPPVGQAIAAKPMQVELRSSLLDEMSRAKDLVDTALGWCTGLALLFALAALGTSGNRPGVLQHLGGWMIGVSVFELVLTWLLPAKVLPRFGESGKLLGQIASDLSGGVVSVLVGVLVAGVVCIVAGRVWSASRRSAEAEVLPQPEPLPV